MKSYLRIIGDVHGAISKTRQTIDYRAAGRTYLSLIKKCQYSIQLGDMGFDYGGLVNLDANRHCWIGGNHDNYDTLVRLNVKGYLGDFGYHDTIPNFPFFFVRGANSIDKQYRINRVSWWEEEELTYPKGMACLESYKEIRPSIVITHDCPASVLSSVVTNPYKIYGSRTNELLESLLEIYRPLLWIFAHHHQNKVIKLEGCRTKFICVQELMYLEVDEKGNLLNEIGK